VDSDIMANYTIEKYQFSILKRNREFIGPFVGISPSFKNNDEIQGIINKSESGDNIYVTDIMVKGAGRNTISVVPVTVVLK